MNALMGLKTRLRLSRTLTWVGLQTNPKTLAELVQRLCREHPDVIVITQPGALPEDLVTGYRSALKALGRQSGQTILGLQADTRAAVSASADLVVTGAGAGAVRGHSHGLSVVRADDRITGQSALDDPDVDAVIVPIDLVARTAAQAPASDPTSKPWFAQVADLDGARRAVGAGARRLAFTGTDVAGYRELLAGPWRDEMERVSFTAFQAK
ncbi:hypothetical protein [Propionimicrobium sp. PCR01-08-3]|uniref:hypothetical protein n=1 Tax=Propionimicrobium sp. PCR01-08-3 TaxID=3052086 RepID=UPI00255CD7F2|nr:hypothetical protein [Propionimicrobium sp. PCR01-08-3]WIY81668.1 hypothetical protein QQ658_09025 [Propionimicrobium sp. PCR01-08-3]